MIELEIKVGMIIMFGSIAVCTTLGLIFNDPLYAGIMAICSVIGMCIMTSKEEFIDVQDKK
jgi:hypothetical protein